MRRTRIEHILSALPPITTEERTFRIGSLGPIGDIVIAKLLTNHASPNRKEVTPYSITSSAAVSKPGGTSRPSALAVCRLMTNSNLVDCKTGRSAGFAPLTIWPV